MGSVRHQGAVDATADGAITRDGRLTVAAKTSSYTGTYALRPAALMVSCGAAAALRTRTPNVSLAEEMEPIQAYPATDATAQDATPILRQPSGRQLSTT